MSELPADAAIQTPVTHGGQQSNFADWLRATRQLIGATTLQQLTISSGVVTPADGASTVLRIDTEGGAASDFLDRIDPTNLHDGSFAIVGSENAAHVVTLRSLQGGSGQFLTADGNSFVLDNIGKTLVLQLISDVWFEVGRWYGSAVSDQRSFLGLGSAAVLTAGTADANLPTVEQIRAAEWAFTGPHYIPEVPLTDQSTITWSTVAAQRARVTISGVRSLANPITLGLRQGAEYRLRVIKGTSGADIGSYGSLYRIIGGPPSMAAASVGSKYLFDFYWDGIHLLGRWEGPYSGF